MLWSYLAEALSGCHVVHSDIVVKFWLKEVPSAERMRPSCCPRCGVGSRPVGRGLQVVGHGLRDRQLRGCLDSDGPRVCIVSVTISKVTGTHQLLRFTRRRVRARGRPVPIGCTRQQMRRGIGAFIRAVHKIRATDTHTRVVDPSLRANQRSHGLAQAKAVEASSGPRPAFSMPMPQARPARLPPAPPPPAEPGSAPATPPPRASPRTPSEAPTHLAAVVRTASQPPAGAIPWPSVKRTPEASTLALGGELAAPGAKPSPGAPAAPDAPTSRGEGVLPVSAHAGPTVARQAIRVSPARRRAPQSVQPAAPAFVKKADRPSMHPGVTSRPGPSLRAESIPPKVVARQAVVLASPPLPPSASPTASAPSALEAPTRASQAAGAPSRHPSPPLRTSARSSVRVEAVQPARTPLPSDSPTPLDATPRTSVRAESGFPRPPKPRVLPTSPPGSAAPMSETPRRRPRSAADVPTVTGAVLRVSVQVASEIQPPANEVAVARLKPSSHGPVSTIPRPSDRFAPAAAAEKTVRVPWSIPSLPPVTTIPRPGPRTVRALAPAATVPFELERHRAVR
jgi:hypothetical protein